MNKTAMTPDYKHNIHGETVKRPYDKYYDYGYDTFTLYKADNWSPDDRCVYSDLLWSSNPEKFNKALEIVWGFEEDTIFGGTKRRHGQMFGGEEPSEITSFLSIMLGIDYFELTGIEQACWQKNGYPYWIFWIKR